jgi:hypothetical protein
MATSLWPYAITDEWKAVGVNFQDFFTNATMSARNGLKTVGSPAVSDGLRLDGSTQFGYYDNPRFITTNGYSFVFEIIPNFDINDGVRYYLLDTTPHNDFALEKTASNLLAFHRYGVSIGVLDKTPWRNYEKNTLIISMKSGDTKIYLNGQLVFSSPSALSFRQIQQLALGAANTGTVKAPCVVKKVAFITNILTPEDMLKLYDGRLLSELDPEKATLFAGLRSSYTNGAGEKVTPVLINGETQEMLFGSDGKTAGEYPDEILPRGWQFDGTAFGNAGDRDEFTPSDPITGDKKFSVCFDFQPSAIATQAGILAKYLSLNDGELRIAQSSSKLQVLLVDQTTGAYIGRVASNNLIAGKKETQIITYDGSGNSNGILLYREGIFDSGTPAFAGSYTQIRNSSNVLHIGTFVTSELPAGSRIYLVQIPPIGVGLSPAQARMWTARARRLKNV